MIHVLHVYENTEYGSFRGNLRLRKGSTIIKQNQQENQTLILQSRLRILADTTKYFALSRIFPHEFRISNPSTINLLGPFFAIALCSDGIFEKN